MAQSHAIGVVLLTNIPSPYQVELFDEIGRRREVDLCVVYTRKSSAGRLWNCDQQISHKHMFLPEVRIKDHWYLNKGVGNLFRVLKNADLVVIAQYASFTMQAAMYYCSLRGIPWVFWSEAIGGVEYEERPLVRNDKLRHMLRHIAVFPVRKWPCSYWGIGSKALESFPQGVNAQDQDLFTYYSDLRPYDRLNCDRRITDQLTFIFSGSLSYRKGFDLVIGAVDILSRTTESEFSVRVIGAGPYADKIPEHLQHYFELQGFIQREFVPKYYGDADVFLFPSRYDGWGLSLIEALAAGIPAIASKNAGATADVIVDGENGWLLQNLSSDGLAERMLHCLQNRSGNKAMSRNAKRSAQCYDITVGAKRFAELVAHAVQKSASIAPGEGSR